MCVRVLRNNQGRRRRTEAKEWSGRIRGSEMELDAAWWGRRKGRGKFVLSTARWRGVLRRGDTEREGGEGTAPSLLSSQLAAVAIRTVSGACCFVPSCTCFSCRGRRLSLSLSVCDARGSISLFFYLFISRIAYTRIIDILSCEIV